ncbi:type II secretion system protein [Aciduricibacillus chroicocephali]|uniref:Type II secretion system protein n=1 Tax=Aciduricibacillus chroicocephali TaxID=3054939 RepID=A0ABY9KUB3_9BACI|nr:type II secretion system protein [Bacillaceae bacterium 44XB]
MRYKVNSPENGFTLIEIIASIVLLAVVISVFLSIFPQMITWSKASEKELVSSNLSAKVAHGIYKGKYSGLAELYKEKPNCSVGYSPVILSTSDNEADSYSKKETINGVEYEISMNACLDNEEVGEKLMRVHFAIKNAETGFIMESFAFYNGGND